MNQEMFTISEDDVAKALGIPRETIREIRIEHLYENEDFGVEKRQIMLSAAGVEKVKAVLKKNAPGSTRTGDLNLPKCSAQAGAKKPGVAVVSRVYVGNPCYLEARMGDLDITVRVRNNRNFTLGMDLDNLLPRPGNDRVWDYAGRLPRARGKW